MSKTVSAAMVGAAFGAAGPVVTRKLTDQGELNDALGFSAVAFAALVGVYVWKFRGAGWPLALGYLAGGGIAFALTAPDLENPPGTGGELDPTAEYF